MVAIDSLRLSEIMRKNRAALATVANWIADADYEHSIFHYGLPRHIRPFIDRPIGEATTYSDLIAYFADLLPGPVRYLEIGVSVGKNFFQMLHHLKDADLTGLDIEDINPVLERFLEKGGTTDWDTMPGSLRKKPSCLTDYAFQPNGNRVRYIAGDVFDGNTWAKLAGGTFNLVFSDAYHSADAIAREWERLKTLDLLDRRAFAMLWDDLDTPEMRAAFADISREMRERFSIPPDDTGIGMCRGWIGPYEPPHAVGLVYKRGP